MLHALLIDDEASARADLRAKLSVHCDVAIVGEAATVAAARALLARNDYELVFLDVQLIGGDSFQLLPLVRPGTSIVFATAHESYALRAFESRAVDYLLKPIDKERLAESLRRVAGAHVSDAPLVVPAEAENSSEVALTADERVFLRQMVETWEDSLRPTTPCAPYVARHVPFAIPATPNRRACF